MLDVVECVYLGFSVGPRCVAKPLFSIFRYPIVFSTITCFYSSWLLLSREGRSALLGSLHSVAMPLVTDCGVESIVVGYRYMRERVEHLNGMLGICIFRTFFSRRLC